MEDLSNSEEYKRAYKRADRICRFMPHVIEKMESPEGESPAQRKAFEDRITEYRIEQDGINNTPRKALFQKYGAKLHRYNNDPSKGKDRTRD